MDQPIRILQFTDLHLFSNTQEKLVGLNPYNSLQKVIAKAKQDISSRLGLIVLTGDISQDYSLESYEIAKKNLSEFSCPIIATMGNHDSLVMFAKVFGATFTVFTLGKWCIVLLDTHYSGRVSGQIEEGNLNFLRESLEQYSDQSILIFLHHQVLPVGSSWVDNIGLKNSAQFLEIVDQYKNIKAVICGHVHQENVTSRFGVDYFSTPSTSWQFAKDNNHFKLDSLMPGYRWLDLYSDGSFKTEVVRIDYSSEFIPDLNSKGY